MQFTSNIPRCSDVMFTFEFPTKTAIGGAICNLAVKAVKLLGVMVGFGEWGCFLGPTQQGDMQKAWIGFPILNANQIYVSDSWAKAPKLGPPLVLPNDKKKNRRFEFEAGKVYTIKHWTMYVDFVRWQLCNFPGMPACSIGNMTGFAPNHVPLYMSIWRKSDDFYYLKTCVANVLHSPRIPPLPTPPSSKASVYSDAYTSESDKNLELREKSVDSANLKLVSHPVDHDRGTVYQNRDRNFDKPNFAADRFGRSYGSPPAPDPNYNYVQDGNIIELSNEDFIVWLTGGLHSSGSKCVILLTAFIAIVTQYWTIAVCCLVAAVQSEWPKDFGHFQQQISNISRKPAANASFSAQDQTPSRRVSSQSAGGNSPGPTSDAGISVSGFARSPPPLVPYSPERPSAHPYPGVADVAITGYRVVQGAKRHVLYTIRYGNYACERRYSDFEILRNRFGEMIESNSEGTCFGFIGWSWLPPLPQKFVFAQFDNAKLERRRLELQSWLRALLTPKFVSPRTPHQAHILLCQFFGMPEKRLAT